MTAGAWTASGSLVAPCPGLVAFLRLRSLMRRTPPRRCVAVLRSGPTLQLAAQFERFAHHPRPAQDVDRLRVQVFGQIDDAEVIMQVDTPDLAVRQPTLVGNGTHDLARCGTLGPPDLDTVGHQFTGRHMGRSAWLA